MGVVLWQYHYDSTTHKCTSHIHNTHITYTQIRISHKITKQTKKTKQISSQSYTNNEGHITANEYSVEKGEHTGLGHLLSSEISRLSHCLDNQVIVSV
jgi:hypothetical protein